MARMQEDFGASSGQHGSTLSEPQSLKEEIGRLQADLVVAQFGGSSNELLSAIKEQGANKNGDARTRTATRGVHCRLRERGEREALGGCGRTESRAWMKTYWSSGPYPIGAGPGPGTGSWNGTRRYPARSFQPGFSKLLSWPSTTWCGQALMYVHSKARDLHI
jgi:hypothetical protein